MTSRQQAGVSLEILPAREWKSAAAAWATLEERAVDLSLACSRVWTETWLQHYGDVVPHSFAVATRGGEPLGAALLARSTHRVGPARFRRLHVGTAGEPPGTSVYVTSNDVLAAPGEEQAFVSALVSALRARRDWDELVLDRFVPSCASLFERQVPGLACERQLSPTLDLTLAPSGDVLGALRPRTRQQVRRSLRILGPVTTELAADPPHAFAILDELIELHQARWLAAGERGAFASRRFVAFHRALIERLLPRGSVMLVRVRAGERTVGCIHNFVQGGRVLSYLMGLMAPPEPKVKPGFVAHAACMQVCVDRGLREYDLLPGPSGYKLELSNTARELVSASALRVGPTAVLVRGMRFAKGKIRSASAS